MTEKDLSPERAFIVDDQVRRRAEAIVLLMGRDYNMSVGVGAPGSGWHWDFANNHVNMDPIDLANDHEDVIKGVASHEGNHRFASRAEHVQDLWREPGFAFGFNAVEDPRVNEAGMHYRPGTRNWIKAYIEKDLSEGGGLDYQHLKEDATGKLGYVPKHMQWGAEIIRYWYKKELADDRLAPEDIEQFLNEIPDEAVRETVKSTVDKFEEFYRAIPDSKDEIQVQRSAKRSCDIFKDSIWPEYKKLVEQSFDDQSIVKMLEDMMNNDQGQWQQGQQGKSGSSPNMSDLPQDVQDEIKRKVKEQKQKNESGNQSNDDGNDASEQGANNDQGSGSGQQQGSTADNAETSGQGQDQSTEASPSDGEGNDDSSSGQIPWDQLSDEAKEAAKKAFEGLSKQLQEDYAEQAKEDIESAEDVANENLRGKMSDPRYNETHEEQKNREAADQEKAKREAASKAISDALRENRDELLNTLPSNPYHEFLQLPDVSRSIRFLDNEFRKIFTPNDAPGVRFSYTGQTINMARAMGFAADKRKGAIFESKGHPTEKSHRFLWEIDLSSSMRDKIAEAFKVVVINTELASKHGLETAVVGFTTNLPGSIRVYKDFDTKKLDKKSRERLGELIPDCYNGDSTPLLAATENCYQILKERAARAAVAHTYFITLTDGSPTDATPEQLKRKVEEIRKDKSIIVAGFGIGYGTHYVNDIYPPLHDRIKQEIAQVLKKPTHEISNSFSSAAEFAIASMVLMRNMVEHPELFQHQ